MYQQSMINSLYQFIKENVSIDELKPLPPLKEQIDPIVPCPGCGELYDVRESSMGTCQACIEKKKADEGKLPADPAADPTKPTATNGLLEKDIKTPKKQGEEKAPAGDIPPTEQTDKVKLSSVEKEAAKVTPEVDKLTQPAGQEPEKGKKVPEAKEPKESEEAEAKKSANKAAEDKANKKAAKESIEETTLIDDENQAKQLAKEKNGEAVLDAETKKWKILVKESKINEGTIVWANNAQKILWDEELSGQVSDGYWENSSPRGHYKEITAAESAISSNPAEQGTFGFVPLRKYNFNNGELLDIVGDRMLAAVMKVIPGYTERELKSDLIQMSKIITNYRGLKDPAKVNLSGNESKINEDKATEELTAAAKKDLKSILRKIHKSTTEDEVESQLDRLEKYFVKYDGDPAKIALIKDAAERRRKKLAAGTKEEEPEADIVKEEDKIEEVVESIVKEGKIAQLKEADVEVVVQAGDAVTVTVAPEATTASVEAPTEELVAPVEEPKEEDVIMAEKRTLAKYLQGKGKLSEKEQKFLDENKELLEDKKSLTSKLASLENKRKEVLAKLADAKRASDKNEIDEWTASLKDIDTAISEIKKELKG